MNAIPKLKPVRQAMLAFSLAVIAVSLHAQDDSFPKNDYVKRQTFTGRSFFKDDNLWVYNESFAQQFGMPKEWISPDIKGVEAAAFRFESRQSDKHCGLGGKAENCAPLGASTCVMNLYIDEEKHALPWREPEQRANWIDQYTSLFWIRTGWDTGELGPATPGQWGLAAFIDTKTQKLLRFFAKTDRELDKRNEMYGGARYSMRLDGYRRRITKQIALLTFNIPCGNMHGRVRPSDHYLSLAVSDGMEVEVFFKAVLPVIFSEQVVNSVDNRASRSAEYFKSILSPRAIPTQPQGDNK